MQRNYTQIETEQTQSTTHKDYYTHRYYTPRYYSYVGIDNKHTNNTHSPSHNVIIHEQILFTRHTHYIHQTHTYTKTDDIQMLLTHNQYWINFEYLFILLFFMKLFTSLIISELLTL